ncbi:acyl-ACP desaturase [Tsukamurella sp. 8F]|uniref:acyl-ACP desaturase n=1 Tax=unclassified Tsukamurella TaxID=2633480 RepID=UPI0023BA1DFA|nr:MULTISPECIES: acyl-ACP desaturase [unclassified Tsukamurella]MDF0529202.1 acyl-ACP desaturase [Tsukamurella sp. 8J]MDF0585387.1 acyl-ACP desaturase [Tsukamurella sp. 8F]
MTDLTELQLLTELEPVVAENIDRHLRVAKNWNPHDYVPWDDGRDFAALGGEDWSVEQSPLSEVARVAMITNLLTEDNLPSYHRTIADNFTLDDAWGAWVGRWTAEENRHGIAMRDYLVATRSVDPVALEQDRMTHLELGVAAPDGFGGALNQVVYVSIQELATRISHRQTARVCDEPVADRLLKRIAADENLHMIFYRNITGAALDLAPDQTMEAIKKITTNFVMPGEGKPGFRRNGVLMVKHGIYDLRQHMDEVLKPIFKIWRVFDRDDLTARGEQARAELAEFMDQMEKNVIRFEESRARAVERERARAAKRGIDPEKVAAAG